MQLKLVMRRIVDAAACLWEGKLATTQIHSFVRRGTDAGVSRIIVPSSTPHSMMRSLEIAKTFPETVMLTAGLNPYHAKNRHALLQSVRHPLFNNHTQLSSFVEQNKPFIAAIGPCGLDLQPNKAYPFRVYRTSQRDVLHSQIATSIRHDLPLIVKARGNWRTLLGCILMHAPKIKQPVILTGFVRSHPLGGAVMKQFLTALDLYDINVLLAVDGSLLSSHGLLKAMITDAITTAGMGRILLASGSPFWRIDRESGPSVSEPSDVYRVAAMVANVLQCDQDDLLDHVALNAHRLRWL